LCISENNHAYLWRNQNSQVVPRQRYYRVRLFAIRTHLTPAIVTQTAPAMSSEHTASAHTEIKHTTCYMCACRCGIRVHLRGGEVRYIDGNPKHPLNQGVICAKGSSGIMKQYSPARLTKPLARKPGSARGDNQFVVAGVPFAAGPACSRSGSRILAGAGTGVRAAVPRPPGRALVLFRPGQAPAEPVLPGDFLRAACCNLPQFCYIFEDPDLDRRPAWADLAAKARSNY